MLLENSNIRVPSLSKKFNPGLAPASTPASSSSPTRRGPASCPPSTSCWGDIYTTPCLLYIHLLGFIKNGTLVFQDVSGCTNLQNFCALHQEEEIPKRPQLAKFGLSWANFGRLLFSSNCQNLAKYHPNFRSLGCFGGILRTSSWWVHFELIDVVWATAMPRKLHS